MIKEKIKYSVMLPPVDPIGYLKEWKINERSKKYSGNIRCEFQINDMCTAVQFYTQV